MAAFLFARALNRTEDFRLASNLDGAGKFDDLVFRYKLREPDVWKTCFIQLKHKNDGGTIRRSSLTQMSGDFSLLKYFKSYCEIKNNAATHPNLKECAPFDDFEFVIYTNQKMESNSPLKGGESDPLNIMCSGTDYGKYVAFDKNCDNDIFEFFKELSEYHEHVVKLDTVLKSRDSLEKEINQTLQKLQNSVTYNKIFKKLDKLQSTENTDNLTKLIDELAKYDFTLFEEFLSKVKIFQNQSNEESIQGLIETEIQDACKASRSVANFIYTKFSGGFHKWWKKGGNVVWLNKNSEQWQAVQKYIITEIKEISKHEIQEIRRCGTLVNQQHVQKLSDAIAQNTVLNIVTNSNFSTLLKLKTYQALNTLGFQNSLFIGVKALIFPRKVITNFWPCKWSEILVVDCGPDGDMAHTVLERLQEYADCGEGLDNSDDNTAETLINVLKKYKQKLILISPPIKASVLPKESQNIFKDFEDNCEISDQIS
jgi:hypothetical protein